ncbi:hypothetical protein ACOME3_006997 [Neoechinorhynchus agilis]
MVGNKKQKQSRVAGRSGEQLNRAILESIFDFSRPGGDELRSGHGFPNRRGGKPKDHRRTDIDQYTRARFQFIFLHGDRFDDFSWTLIKQVRCFDHQLSKCLICLSEPVAAKVTRCGHIFCWHCILRHTTINGTKTWCQCPACSKPIELCTLKSFEQLVVHGYEVNDTIEMHHMYVENGDVVDPLAETEVSGLRKNLFVHVRDLIDQVLMKESLEIDAAIEEVKASCDPTEELNMAFLEMAKRKCMTQIDRYLSLLETSAICESSDLKEDLTFEARKTRPIGTFYQSSDGQRIYLHPINIRCLDYEHRSSQKYPMSLSGRVVSMETFFVNEDTHKRYRFIKHLDFGVECHLVELDLSHLLSARTLVHFDHLLKQRQEERETRRRRDSKSKAVADMRSQQEMRKAINVGHSKNHDGNSVYQNTEDVFPCIHSVGEEVPQQVTCVNKERRWPVRQPILRPPTNEVSTEQSLSVFDFVMAAKKKEPGKRGRNKNKGST